METGIIVLAHGSKIKSGTEGLFQVVNMIQEMGEYKVVKPAFLQLSPPSLEDAVKSLVQRQIRKIIIMPLLLFSGNHVVEDIPQAIAGEKTKYPHITFVMAENIGPDPRIARIACERIDEVLL